MTGDEVRREVGQAAETTQEYLAQKSAEYREALARQIDDLDQRLKEMASESSRIAPEARTEWNARLARVQKDLQRAKDELADHSKKAWNDFQRDADAAWSDVKAGFDEAAEYLREKASPPSDDAAQHTTTPAETPRGDD